MRVRFLIVHAFLIVILLFISSWLNQETSYSLSMSIKNTCIMYFSISNIFAGLFFLNLKNKTEKQKAFLIMVLRSSKFLLTLFFALTMILIVDGIERQVGLTIVILYFIYTIVELILFRFLHSVDNKLL